MSKILFGIQFIDKINNLCFTTGSVKYLSKETVILDVNNEGLDVNIKRKNIKKIKLLRKNV